MDAVAALYSEGDEELSGAIVAGLSRAVFDGGEVKPAGRIRNALARVTYRILQWTTKTGTGRDEAGAEVAVVSNTLLERSGHPYSRALLTPSRSATAALVEGGDPMNAPYMMLVPEIVRNCRLWDRLFFDSVQGKDVRARFVWETRSTYEAARALIEKDKPVRLKAVAAGTGLSMILAYDKLIRDGFNPYLITARITDRETANIEKANRLLRKLATTRERMRSLEGRRGISAVTEDIFPQIAGEPVTIDSKYDVVTAVGILEYFRGFSYATTGQRLKIEPSNESATAQDLVVRLREMMADRAHLILNTYVDHASTRVLELFGKRFHYRRRDNLSALLASVGFRPTRLAGSGHIYDVEVYEKHCP
jgi:hypothetical protein